MNCLILAVNPIVNDSRILRIAGFFSKTSGPDQIDVLGLGDEPGDFSHWPARVSVATRPSLINVPAVLRWLLSSLAYLLLVLQTSFALRGRSGIVWSADADSILYGWLVSRLLGWKFIYDAHEFWPAESKRRRGSSILLLSERWLIKQAHAVVTVSQGMAESYQNFYSLDRRPLVIYNTPEVRSSESMKLALNFKTEHVFTLLYQGHLVEDRQILPFIKAFRSRRRTQPMRLAFLGHGPLFEQLLALQDDDLVVHQSVNPDQLLNITRTASGSHGRRD